MIRSHSLRGSLRWLSLAALALVLAACGQPVATMTTGDLQNRQINVVTTVGMIGDLARNIGGERVEVTALMGPGVDPHLYKATAGDVQTLEQADIIFYGGLELEGRMTDIFVKLAATRPTVAVSDEVPRDKLREPPEFQGKYDPHIWFDVTLWKYPAQKVAAELSRIDPSSAALYQSNLDAYLKQLDELHEYVKAE